MRGHVLLPHMHARDGNSHLARRERDVEPIVDSVVFLKDGHLLLAGDADDLRQDCGMSLDALFRKEYR